jgi:protein involved in polysaccharide export with SLBB domain
MRIFALAAALLMLISPTLAAAQSAAELQSLAAQYPDAAAALAGSAGGVSASQVAAAARSSQLGGGVNLSANPLAGATAASAAPSSPVSPTQNGEVGGTIVTSDGVTAPVFGTDLFTGSFAGTRPSDRPDYVIQIGDQVVVNMFGAVNSGSSQTVDAAGNVFITGIGPVHVGGVTAGALQGVIAGRVHQVYTGAVGVYAQVGSAGSLGVFVSGDVRRPGRYLGSQTDSVMFYLSQAGGIDPARGSFRNIIVQRHGQTIATYDLYDFLLKGQVQPIRFEEGDVVFVAPRGAMVAVDGPVRNAFAFEAPRGEHALTGADIIPLARPEPTVTGAALQGFRNGSHRSAYFPLSDFARVVLSDGDHVAFRSDTFRDLVTVNIAGEVKGPTVYVLPRGATLSQLLAKIPLQGTDVDTRYVHIQRATVAMEQKRALDDALYQLQKQVLTATPATAEQATLLSAQATQINQFVATAKTVQPDGNIAVYSNGQFQDIRLEDGDVVVLPNRTDVVIVAGEILNPGALAHANNLTIKGYIAQAGGFASHADKHHFVIRHLDGSAEVADEHTRPVAGDEIVVLPKVGSQWFQYARDISQLLFQIAVTAGTAVTLTKNL